MDKEILEAVYDSYKRIDQSLSERFEKDVRLYAPMEEVESIKKLLYNGNYQVILDKYNLKKITPEVLTNIIIKNAWLMKSMKGAEVLKPIFNGCEKRYLQYIMLDGIFDNKIDMPRELRFLLIEDYLSRIDSFEAEQILQQRQPFINQPQIRITCIISALRDLPLTDRYSKFSSYAKETPYIMKKASVFKAIFSIEDVEKYLVKPIFDDHIKNLNKNEFEFQSRLFWSNFFNNEATLKIFSFLEEYFKGHASQIEMCKTVAKNISLLIKKDPENFCSAFVQAVLALDADARNSVIRKIYNDNKDQQKYLSEALEKFGITPPSPDPGSKVTWEKIVDVLNQTYNFCRAKGWLVYNFEKISKRNALKNLDRLREEVDENTYSKFICELVQQRPYKVFYLTYAITHLDLSVKRNNLRHILQCIEKNDVLNNSNLDPNRKRQILQFVKKYDFEMFKRLTLY